MLVEVIDVRFALAEFRLQPRPTPRVPPKGCLAVKIAGGLGNSGFAGRVGAEETIGEAAVALAYAVNVILWGTRRRKARAFVRVVADQDGRVVELLGIVHLVLVV